MDIHGMAPKRRVEAKDGGYVVYVKPPAFVGGPEVSVKLSPEQFSRYQLWREGAGMIQDLLWDLNDSEREMLMSGLTDEHFAKIAGDD